MTTYPVGGATAMSTLSARGQQVTEQNVQKQISFPPPLNRGFYCAFKGIWCWSINFKNGSLSVFSN